MLSTNTNSKTDHCSKGNQHYEVNYPISLYLD